MEVHHHPNVEKKNFKEYFLEFIMIFLAVTLGFFAENLRENFSDHSKTNQFAQSLVSDLKEDTEACNNTLLNMNYFIGDYDTLLSLLNEENASVNKLYYYFRNTTVYNYFNGITRTIDQLKSTGGLRLFEDHHVSDSINDYYQKVKFVTNYTSTYLKYFEEYHHDAFELFAYSEMSDVFNDPEKLLDTSKKIRLLDNDYKLRQRVYNKLFVLRIITLAYMQFVKDVKRAGDSCIHFLKYEYSL